MLKKGFTPKQRVFIAEYIACKNATRAAKRAGYSAKTARAIGSENLTKPDIFAAIEKGLKEQLDKAEVSAAETLEELKRIAFADVYGGRCSNQLRALEILGKAMGLFQNNDKHDRPRTVLNTTDCGQEYREPTPLDLIGPIIQKR